MKKDRSKYCQTLARVLYYQDESGCSRKLCIYADNSPRHIAFQILDAYPKLVKMEPAKIVMALEQLFAQPEFLKLGKQVVASITEAFDAQDSLEESEKRLRQSEKSTEKIRRDYVECYQRAERAQKPLTQFLNALTAGKKAA
jgi:hypothetical protein